MAHIKADMTVDSKGFVQGVENAEDALETLIDTMDDAEKESLRSADKMEKGLKDVTEAAKDTDRAARNVGKGFKQSASDASEGLQEIKDESASTAKEAAASFDGSAESIIDAFQEVAANAFAGFGPAGALAGIAAAAGIGIASAAILNTEEAARSAKQRVTELGVAFIESGADVAKVEAFQAALQGIITNADDAAVKVDDLRKLTKKYGDEVPSVSQFAMAYAGNADAIEQVTEQLEKAIEAEKEKNYTTKTGAEQSAKRQDAYQGEIDKLQKVQEETELAAQIEKDWLASGGAEAQAKADAIGVINAAYDDAVYSVDNFKNAETGIYDLEAYAQSIRDREQLLKDYQSSLADSGLTTDQKAALNEMGIEQAQAILNGLKDPSVSDETKKTIKNGLKTASQEGSGVAKKEIEEAFKKPVDATVKVKADTSAAQQDLDNLIKARTAVIKLDFQDRYGKRVY